MIDHPPVDVPACVARAAAHYGAGAADIAARVAARKGQSGLIRHLPNGDIEVGISAIPGRDIAALGRGEITAQLLADNDCLNVTIFTYLIQRDRLLAMHVTRNPSATSGKGQTTQGARPKQELSPQVRQCISGAASRYSLPLPVFQAVLRTEGGWSGLKKPNTNGTYDMGVAQINTIHLPELRKYGISEQMLVNDSCTNVHVAAYRLRSEINRVPDFWVGVGNYHSRTPHLNRAYQARVRRNMAKL